MIEISSADMMRWVASLMWPFLRISGMLISAPIFGARSMPVRIRILLAVAIAMLVAPVIPPVPSVDLISPQSFLISINQVLIGIVMGFMLQLVFSSFVLAGQAAAMSMGLGFASMIDPQNGVQVPLVSQIYLILVTLIFLALDGHLMLISLMLDSFRLLPIGMVSLSAESLHQLALWGSQMFASGVLVALPVITGLLLVNLSFGVASRAAPQLNIFTVGFPVMILAGFAFVLLSLPGLDDQLSHLLEQAFAQLREWLANSAI